MVVYYGGEIMKKIIIIAMCLCILGIFVAAPLMFWGMSLYFSHTMISTVCMFTGAIILGIVLGVMEAI